MCLNKLSNGINLIMPGNCRGEFSTSGKQHIYIYITSYSFAGPWSLMRLAIISGPDPRLPNSATEASKCFMAGDYWFDRLNRQCILTFSFQ